ncbi:MAG TPA: hypothetical protein EYP65_05470, partial [Armatimonadetes bacterium]|nr:hypothetical protein [Armatimonadota bacterium]
TAVRVGRPLTIDGDLSDWPEGPQIVLDGTEGNHIEGWRGPNDLSAKIRLAWDGSALYFGAEVVDDVHRQDHEGFDIWRGDCIQIGFDPFLDTVRGYDENDVEIGLALTKFGPQAFIWFPKPERPCPEVEVSVKRKGNLTVYEASIPWRLLGVEPSAGFRLAFSLTVNESDTGKFEGWLEWTPGICGGKDASSFGALALKGGG